MRGFMDRRRLAGQLGACRRGRRRSIGFRVSCGRVRSTTMTVILDGPRMPPARGGKPDALVVLLHGYGSNGADLISLAPYWTKALPGVAFVSPNAIEPAPQAPGGYQWFPISNLDPQLMESGARRAAESVDRFLDRELERCGL